MFWGRRRFAVLECTSCQTQRILPKVLKEQSSAVTLYNEYASDFSEAELTKLAQTNLRRLQETELHFENDLRVLDVGCGSGVLLETICSRYGCIGHGIDVDRRRIETALAESKHVTFECGLFEPSPASLSQWQSLNMFRIQWDF
jgi:cyclopropane fatty-acyl-phospholipid synthase-like methyltransferase